MIINYVKNRWLIWCDENNCVKWGYFFFFTHFAFHHSGVGGSYIPSLYLGLRPNYVRGNGDLLQKDLCQDAVAPMTVVVSARDYAVGHCQPTPVLEAPGHSAANLAQSLVGSLFLSPASWCIQGFCCALQESVSPVLWKFYNQIPLTFKVKFPGDSQSLCWICWITDG